MSIDTKKWSCVRCKCTDDFACKGGCFWVGYRLCSACATAQEFLKWLCAPDENELLKPPPRKR